MAFSQFYSVRLPLRLLAMLALVLALPALAAGMDPVAQGDGVQAPGMDGVSHADLSWADDAVRKAISAPPARRGNSESRPAFSIPVDPAIGYEERIGHGISFFVDHNANSPDQVVDYFCGSRSYDTASGYNHNGTDYYIWPFRWRSMQNDAMRVVAAAPGIIITKRGGQDDKSCMLDPNALSNMLEIEHDDGSRSRYLHMKLDSITEKAVGQRVDTGEYLGIVGSSGNSTAPHLHFGVRDAEGNLIDPFAGTCNALNTDSWWQNQAEYYDATVTAVHSHSAPPEFPACPQEEVPNFRDQFSAGDSLVVSGYVRDFGVGQDLEMTVRRPDGSVFASETFEQSATQTLRAYYRWYEYPLPANAPAGAWTVEARVEDSVGSHTFYVDASPPKTPVSAPENVRFAGLWFNPDDSGEGYNFITSRSGFVVYYYGNDRDGQRLWLVSEGNPADVVPGEPLNMVMYESTGGSFDAPITSGRGLSRWGTLDLTFQGCDRASVQLTGRDGIKSNTIQTLAPLAGIDCESGDVSPGDAGISGLWFDPSLGGEGFTIAETSSGLLLYYYGFDEVGQRLWLISDVDPDPIELGERKSIDLYQTRPGTFADPEGAIETWGRVDITFNSCTSADINMTGKDGAKISNTVLLASTVNNACNL